MAIILSLSYILNYFNKSKSYKKLFLIVSALYIITLSKYIKLLYHLKTVKFTDFKNYVHIVNSIYPTVFDPQYIYVDSAKLDFVGREETFNSDFQYLLDTLKIKTPIINDNIIENRKNGSFYKYIDKYDDHTIKFVNHYYRRDFEYFGYSMIK